MKLSGNLCNNPLLWVHAEAIERDVERERGFTLKSGNLQEAERRPTLMKKVCPAPHTWILHLPSCNHLKNMGSFLPRMRAWSPGRGPLTRLCGLFSQTRQKSFKDVELMKFPFEEFILSNIHLVFQHGTLENGCGHDRTATGARKANRKYFAAVWQHNLQDIFWNHGSLARRANLRRKWFKLLFHGLIYWMSQKTVAV